MNVKLITRLVLISFAVSLFVLFFCEFLIYYVLISLCYWPTIRPNNDIERAVTPVKAMVFSDPHLLGSIRGHWFDKLRREWQMWRSFQTTVYLLGPELVIVLGDVFDEGLWASDQDFEVYVNRFYDMFATHSDTQMIVVVGNHDIGFHYWTDRYLRRRFQMAFNTTDIDLIEISDQIHFVSINSIALEGDECYLCVNAVNKIKEIGERLRDEKIFPIILMHFPLYRKSEEICTESDSASDEIKKVRYKERLDCLSKEATELVLNELNPRLVLSGHSHHSCVVNHKAKSRTITEWTVASFSWRNKKNPSFLLVSITSDDYSINKCFLPNESTVFLIYFICFSLLFVYTFRQIVVNYRIKHKNL